MSKQDTLLISFVESDISNNPILIVGKKNKNETLKVINMFQGDEAVNLYKRLMSKKEK